MEHTAPTRNEILVMDRLECSKCGREALALTADGVPLCARHATIFMTVRRIENRQSTIAR